MNELKNLKALFDELSDQNSDHLDKLQFKKLLNIIGMLDSEQNIEDTKYSFDDVVNFIKTYVKNNYDYNTIKLNDLKKGINSTFDKNVANILSTQYFSNMKNTDHLDDKIVNDMLNNLQKI
jgi:hypothetical protein